MKRIYEHLLTEHFNDNRQMAFVSGPRQVGKTTTCRGFTPGVHYYSWDDLSHRTMIVQGPAVLADTLGLNHLMETAPFVLFDEIHKYGKWKSFIKGMFDSYSDRVRIVVTGSSRLDVFKKGGDSLMGRYFLYHLHPLSLAEVISPELSETEIRPPASQAAEDILPRLLKYGGFPEPFLKASSRFSIRWNGLRQQQLFREDLRDTSRVQEIGQIEILAELLKAQAGHQTSYASLARKVNISVDTAKRWLTTLSAVHYCYLVRPWTKNVTRSLLKEPKVYLWDWSLVDDEGSRYENLVAGHLYKAVQFWNDRGLGVYGLHYLRDKSGREADFVVTKNNAPWFLVEAKLSAGKEISEALRYYQKMIGAPHAFQVAYNMDPVNKNCFSIHDPIIVPARTFLSQLV